MQEWKKAKALRNHTYGFYSVGDVVEVKPDSYSGAYKVRVKKQGQIIARCHDAKRNFKLLK